MLQRYEALMLAVPELTKDETILIEKQIDDIVRKANGSVLSFERWGKYKLEYPVHKNEYGVYLLSRFEIPQNSSALTELKTAFAIKLNLIIMRHMLHSLANNTTLVYQRPKSLEEAPETIDNRGFLKDHRKIEGLISAVDSSARFTEESEDEDNEELV